MKALQGVQKDTRHSKMTPSLLHSLKVQKGLLGYSSGVNRTRGRMSTFAVVFWLLEGTRKTEPAGHPVTLFPELSMVVLVSVTPTPQYQGQNPGSDKCQASSLYELQASPRPSLPDTESHCILRACGEDGLLGRVLTV